MRETRAVTLHEPAVALTDYGIALLCAFFAVRLVRADRPAGGLRGWWALFFAAVGLAALAGGTVHGLAPGPGPAHEALWRLTLLAIGVAAFAGFGLGARKLLAPAPAHVLTAMAGALWVVYAVVVLAVSQRFFVAVVHYLPAVLFLGGAFVVEVGRSRPGAGQGLAGLVLTLVAAGLQQARVGLGPVDHNTLYHLVQALGLWLLDRGARAA